MLSDNFFNMAAINSLEEFEDTKGVIRIRKSKMDRKHNVRNKKNKRTNNDLQNIKQKTKDRVTRTPQTTSCISILKPTIDMRCDVFMCVCLYFWRSHVDSQLTFVYIGRFHLLFSGIQLFRHCLSGNQYY